MFNIKTRKGLALAAGLSLIASAVTTAPANATGLDSGLVSLSPTAGTVYSTLVGQTFDLKSNLAPAAAVTGGDLKFFVEDADKISRYDVVNSDSLATGDNVLDNATVVGVAADSVSNLVALYFAANPGIQTGDAISLSAISTQSSGLTAPEIATANSISAALSGSSVAVAMSGGSSTSTHVAVTDSGTTDTVEIFFSATHSFQVGDRIDVSGAADATPTGLLAAGVNGSRVVTATTSNSVTFTGGQAASANIAKAAATNVVVQRFAVYVAMSDVRENLAYNENVALTVTELTRQNALDSRANLLVATFGSLGASGAVATTPNTLDSAGTTGRADNGSYVVNTQDESASGVDSTLRLTSTAKGSVTVTAWIDANLNNVIDSTENRSPARIVTFVAPADATFTTAFSAPIVGDALGSGLVATVTIEPAINMHQLASGDVRVEFRANNATLSETATAASFNSTTGELKTGATGIAGNAAASTVYSAQAFYAGAVRGTAVFVTTEAPGFNVGGLNTNTGVTAPAVEVSDSWNGTNVKTGTKAVELVSEVTGYTTSGTAPAAPAGIKALVTVTATKLAATSTVVGGGKTLTSVSAPITFEVLTNADGEVVIPLTTSGAKEDSVVVSVRVQDAFDNLAAGNAGYTTAVSTTLTWADATVAKVIDLASAGSSERQLARGGSWTINYLVVDNFGATVTSTGLRLSVASANVTGGASVAGFVPVTDGKATFTFTDNTVPTTGGSYDVVATLQKINSGATAYANVAGVTAATTNVKVSAKTVATISTTVAMKATDTKKGLETKTLISGDSRTVPITFPYGASGNSFQITGHVRAADGQGLAGQPVTVTSAGIGFTTATSGNSNVIYGLGSITVWTDTNGAYTVYAYSNKAGTAEFTVAAASVSRTTSAIYAEAAETAGATLNLNVPATVAPGTTLKISGTLVDKFGNPVAAGATSATKFRVSYAGPGFAQAAPTELDEDGAFTMNVLFGSSETGTATITARYDQNGDGDYADAKDITVAKTVTIVAPAAPAAPEVNAVIGSFNGRWAVRVENAKGAVVSVKVGGNWYKYTSLNENYLFSRKSAVGRSVAVAVYVNGTLENVATITVK